MAGRLDDARTVAERVMGMARTDPAIGADRSPALVSIESDGPDCPHHLEETTSRVDNIVTWIHRIIG